jgi:hypothetical protein
MAKTRHVVPCRGKIKSVELYHNAQLGQDRIRVQGDPDGDGSGVLETAPIQEWHVAIGYTPVAGKIYVSRVVEWLNDGDCATLEFEGPDAFTQAIDTYMAGKSPDDVRADWRKLRYIIPDSAVPNGVTKGEQIVRVNNDGPETFVKPNRVGVIVRDLRPV